MMKRHVMAGAVFLVGSMLNQSAFAEKKAKDEKAEDAKVVKDKEKDKGEANEKSEDAEGDGKAKRTKGNEDEDADDNDANDAAGDDDDDDDSDDANDAEGDDDDDDDSDDGDDDGDDDGEKEDKTPASTVGDKKITVGGDLHIGLPIGGLSDFGGLGLGLKARAEYWLLPNVAVGLRLGYVYHFATGAFNFSYVPVHVGGRYFFSENRTGGYAGGEVGPNFGWSSGELLGVSVSGSGTDFGLALRGGYVLSGDLPIDIGAHLHFMNLSKPFDTMVFALEGGYTFAGF